MHPQLGDGTRLKDIPPHGIFNNEDTVWREYFLGDFDSEDLVEIQDYSPDNGGTGLGEIQKFHVEISGDFQHGDFVHFDLYDHVLGETKGLFAPFSHDAEMMPEPSSVLLWGVVGGVFGIGCWFRRRRRIPA